MEQKKIGIFQEMKVWQKAHALVLEIYRVAQIFPEHERYGLVSQIRRAAVSIPTNLSEGGKRASRRDYAHFVNMAESSLEEVKYLVLLAKDLGYLKLDTYEVIIEKACEIGRMLFGLRKNLFIAEDLAEYQKVLSH